jgi:hypothetical protein
MSHECKENNLQTNILRKCVQKGSIKNNYVLLIGIGSHFLYYKTDIITIPGKALLRG